MDSYLHRFERYALAQSWNKDLWATHLSALLKGKALNVYALLPSDQALDYDALKMALLKRYELTEDGFKRKFRSCRPELGETFCQFSVRMSSYLTKWIEMASTPKTYEGLFDLMMRDQLLHICNRDLALFLKERTPISLPQMATIADQYKEARLTSALSLTFPQGLDKKNSRHKSPNERVDTGKKFNSKLHKSERRCFKCDSPTHTAVNCPLRRNKVGNVASNSYPRKGSNSPVRGRSRSLSPSPRVRFSDTEYDRSRNRVRNDNRDKDQRSDEFANCGACTSFHDSIVNVNVTDAVPQITTSCGIKMSSMPTTEGKIGQSRVSVLRDTGCSGVVVKKSLVTASQYTGKEQTCILADGSKISVPLARLFVDTPYFTGEVDAWCMERPMYELIIGNIKDAREPNNPDENWGVGAVQTRQQVRNAQTLYPQLKVPEAIKDVSPDDIRLEQSQDISLAKIRKLVEEGSEVEGKHKSTTSYVERNGLIYRKFQSPKVQDGKKFMQLVVPLKYRNLVLKLAHESIMAGHMGIARTVSRVLSEYFWPGVQADTKRYCRSCDICQRTIPKGKVKKVPLGKMPLIDEPFKRVAVDIIGPLCPVTDNKNRYIVTLVDYATRYPEAVALPNIETERVAEALIDIFCRVGFPSEMLTDLGSQFTSSLMNEICRLISLRQLTTTAYHPMCNGLCEKLNGTLKLMLKRVCAERP